MVYNRYRSRIFEKLHSARLRVLMVDYDGTLAPFSSERGKAYPYPGVIDILGHINESDRTRVIIISGRMIKDLIPLLQVKNLPEIWGSHGWERQDRYGGYRIWPTDERYLDGLAFASRIIKKRDLKDYCEEKPRSLAIHWRGAEKDEISSIRAIVLNDYRQVAMRFGLEIKEFEGGLELRVPGRNKGDVVKSIIGESPRDSFLVYLGDDRTDEDAFKAIEGHGVGILVREEFRPTNARYHLRPPEELIEFLDDWRNHES